MVYNVYRTDGNLLTTVNDGTVNTTTSLQLVGIGYQSYSELIAENLVHIMENFSNVVAPLYPLVGQMWWDRTNKQLNVYDGDTFRFINNVQFASLAPDMPKNGDFWYDTNDEQLKIFKDDWKVISPDYTAGQGISGQVIKTIEDVDTNPHVVTVQYNNNEIVAVLSNELTSYDTGDLPGVTTINAGINLGYGFELHGTSSLSHSSYGLLPEAHANYMHANSNTRTLGNVEISGISGIFLGNSDVDIYGSVIKNRTEDNSLLVYNDFNLLKLQYVIDITDIDGPGQGKVGINNPNPYWELDVNGSVGIDQNLWLLSPDNNNGVYWATNVLTGIVHNDQRLFIYHDASQIMLEESGMVTISTLTVADGTTTHGITNLGQIVNPEMPEEPTHLANKEYVDQADEQNRLPIGSVIMWYGAAVDVPVGWHICDGTSGTPDLRDRFVWGAGGSAEVGDEGGTDYHELETTTAGAHVHDGTTDVAGEHDHTSTTGSTNLTIDQIPSHSHSLSNVLNIQSGGGQGRHQRYDYNSGILTQTGNAGGGSGHAHDISIDGEHSHDLITGISGSHSHTVEFDNRPSWVALYFIMRVS